VNEIFGHRANWATWVGVEVEGRLSGLRTLFVASDPLPSIIDVPHVYFWEQYWKISGFAQVQKCLDDKVLVTLETTLDNIANIPKQYIEQCHLMIKIPASSISSVKETDTVRLDIAPYLVKASPLFGFKTTEEKEYYADEPVTYTNYSK